MLLMALPEGQREVLISAKKLTALKIVCHLLVTHQPAGLAGGLAEKEWILRQLESPREVTTLGEAVQSLRRWGTGRFRTGSPPKKRIIRRPLQASFRISLARSTLQVDATPTFSLVTSFAMHLLAGFEQVAHQEVGTRKKGEADKLKNMKTKKFEEDTSKGFGGKGKDKDGEKFGDRGDRVQLNCRYYLISEGGRKKGKECSWSNDLIDERRQCWNCGGTDHLASKEASGEFTT